MISDDQNRNGQWRSKQKWSVHINMVTTAMISDDQNRNGQWRSKQKWSVHINMVTTAMISDDQNRNGQCINDQNSNGKCRERETERGTEGQRVPETDTDQVITNLFFVIRHFNIVVLITLTIISRLLLRFSHNTLLLLLFICGHIQGLGISVGRVIRDVLVHLRLLLLPCWLVRLWSERSVQVKVIIITDHFRVALFSGLHKHNALYNILWHFLR